MKIRLILVSIGILVSAYCKAQPDTTQQERVYKDFSNFTDMLQLSMGQNLTVGQYGRGQVPFYDGYASTYHFMQFSLNVKYSGIIKERIGWSIGAEFFRNVFDFRKFDESYLKTTGDSSKISDFEYEHISVFGGVNYMLLPHKRLLLAVDFGGGLLYNNAFNGDDGIQIQTVDFTPNGNDSYKGGYIFLDRRVSPLVYSSFNARYYLGDEFYIIAGGHFTYSVLDIRITEQVSFSEQRPYLNTTIPVNNISLTLGLGTLL